MTSGAPPPKWFYRSPRTQEEEGPFDLVELAGFLAAGDFTAETPIRSDGAEDWMPFQKHREFQTAKEIPIGVVMRHLENKKREREESAPLTAKHVYHFFWFLGGLALYISQPYILSLEP